MVLEKTSSVSYRKKGKKSGQTQAALAFILVLIPLVSATTYNITNSAQTPTGLLTDTSLQYPENSMTSTSATATTNTVTTTSLTTTTTSLTTTTTLPESDLDTTTSSTTTLTETTTTSTATLPETTTTLIDPFYQTTTLLTTTTLIPNTTTTTATTTSLTTSTTISEVNETTTTSLITTTTLLSNETTTTSTTIPEAEPDLLLDIQAPDRVTRGADVEIIANFEARINITNLTYTWELPEGFIIINGYQKLEDIVEAVTEAIINKAIKTEEMG